MLPRARTEGTTTPSSWWVGVRPMVLEVLLLAALLAGSLAPLMALPPERSGCEPSSWGGLPITIDVNHTIRAADLGLHPGLAL